MVSLRFLGGLAEMVANCAGAERKRPEFRIRFSIEALIFSSR